MVLKTVYTRGKEAIGLIMLGVSFYKKYEDEINTIATQIKKYFNKIKKDWNHYWDGFDMVDSTNLIKDVDIDYNKVVEWVSDKNVVTTKEISDVFKVNPIEALLVIRQLENNHIVAKEIGKTGSFIVLKKEMCA